MALVIDIETIPRPGIMDTWFPEWAAQKNPDATPEELERMAGLHAEFGMVCAVGYASPDTSKPVHSLTAATLEAERDMLVQFAETLQHYGGTLIGHNIKAFDIPFLAKRYMAHRLRVPDTLCVAGKKPWEVPHVDTLQEMKFGGDCSMSLRSACLLLGLGDPKADCSGGEVWDLFKAGDMGAIARYVESDVDCTRSLWRALLGAKM